MYSPIRRHGLSLALFDLDNTLLAGDSDHLWGEFLCEQGIVDSIWYRQENERYYQLYRQGELDIQAFLRFSLQPLAAHPMSELLAWRMQFMRQKIEPVMLPAARALLDRHRRAGDTLVIITATNRFITEPIAAAFGVEHLLATEPAMAQDRYTGEVVGTPCFQNGKVERLRQWLHGREESLSGSHFYSDSRNDLPLLSQVDNPVAVDPDEVLLGHARGCGWPVISLRQDEQPVRLA
jgi:HAD superfamily hydrolase (TIGR01490 family)